MRPRRRHEHPASGWPLLGSDVPSVAVLAADETLTRGTLGCDCAVLQHDVRAD
jgi:hypothetical protein